MIQATIYLVNKVARASDSYALMSLSNRVLLDINQDPLAVIEKDIKGLYSGDLGNSSNETS